jgi:DNA-binding Lrp family transcriptional regulator
MADKLEIPCQLLLDRIQSLMADKTIRRFGASLDSRKFGYHSTLAAISVDENLVEQASKIIAEFPEITHSYLRSDPFNIWFTIIAPDSKRIEAILEEIQSRLSLSGFQVLNLPVNRLFKLNARFKISPQ